MIKNSRTIKGFAASIVGAALFVSVSSPAQALTDEGMLAKGGQLYDWFYKITYGDVPKKTHAAMPADAGQTGKKTWRCVNCHGYDYNGDVGLPGISKAAGKDPAEIIAILKDGTHNYTTDIFNDEEFQSLGVFVSKGQIDVAAAKGDVAKGQGYFETVCAVCHGPDGKKITDMPPLGAVVNKLPERSLHRIRFSKPAVDMPSLAAFSSQVAVDVWTYAKTLPQE